MTERRARGTSPAGRGDRRTSRAARSRPRAGADPESAARPAAAKRARRREGADKKKAEPRKIAARSADKPERTILGLSTGKAVVLAVVVCALALTLSVPMRTYFGQRAEAAQLAQERRELEADLARLRDRRAQQQDPAYIRSEAKDRLRLVMPGETPYIVQVPGIEAPPRPAPPTKSKVPDPWYTDLWRTISEPPQTTEPAPSPTTPPPPGPEGPR
ncbi:septum formation initiator family protein [Nocardia puris]|uniref:Septum formation initiator n=1 Tax=Nocardia puris TaxID=208602 RepID=A0A366DRW5_9NOCA|nr:septum formation initiator family protein [Nocardia puris]MBF6210688.1 septum formation initiator family protein [Nocardia puris]MBF6364295.1 septum formation initiator family protein [Nocardia puris]MBF6459224.1 septum formation initiator family protein [Nocardia puris]RBO92822.1 septum formation initiator [Nocardia puris]